jgi:hypothetical protein
MQVLVHMRLGAAQVGLRLQGLCTQALHRLCRCAEHAWPAWLQSPGYVVIGIGHEGGHAGGSGSMQVLVHMCVGAVAVGLTCVHGWRTGRLSSRG